MSDYKSAINGRFSGILRWPQFDELWHELEQNPEGWHVYEPEKSEPPKEPFSAQEMKEFLASTKSYLLELCTDDFCGAVYADHIAAPTFIKIYNPRLMGGCGMGRAPLPQWIISRMVPVSLLDTA